MMATAAPLPEPIGTVESRTRAVPPIDVFLSAGRKRKLVTISGRDGAIDLDASAIDQLQAVLDVAKRRLV